MFSFYNDKTKYFHGSKKYKESLRKINIVSETKTKKLEWYSGLNSCLDICFALRAEEFKNDEDVRYQLRLNFWRQNNKWDYPFDDFPEATAQIYEKLMNAWHNQTDERYLYRAEMLRNMGKFKESNELLKNPLPEYKPVLEKHKKWVKVIKTMNRLKYKKTIEITI